MSDTPTPMNPPIVIRVRQPFGRRVGRVVVGRQAEQRGDPGRGGLRRRALRPTSGPTAARQRALALALTNAGRGVVVSRP